MESASNEDYRNWRPEFKACRTRRLDSPHRARFRPDRLLHDFCPVTARCVPRAGAAGCCWVSRRRSAGRCALPPGRPRRPNSTGRLRRRQPERCLQGDRLPAYEALHPGRRVLLNFAASGALLQQAANGAPVDVFASADQETMDQAERLGLVAAAARRDFAANSLVVVVPAGAPAPPKALADLRRPAFGRIAVGAPASVPAGRYAKAALERAGLWTRPRSPPGRRAVGAPGARLRRPRRGRRRLRLRHRCGAAVRAG